MTEFLASRQWTLGPPAAGALAATDDGNGAGAGTAMASDGQGVFDRAASVEKEINHFHSERSLDFKITPR